MLAHVCHTWAMHWARLRPASGVCWVVRVSAQAAPFACEPHARSIMHMYMHPNDVETRGSLPLLHHLVCVEKFTPYLTAYLTFTRLLYRNGRCCSLRAHTCVLASKATKFLFGPDERRDSPDRTTRAQIKRACTA